MCRIVLYHLVHLSTMRTRDGGAHDGMQKNALGFLTVGLFTVVVCAVYRMSELLDLHSEHQDFHSSFVHDE